MTQLERVEFDIDSIREAAQLDLPATLRALADAIDGGDLDGRLWSLQAHGFAPRHDNRVHVHVTLDFAAHLFRYRDGFMVDLDEPASLVLPVAPTPKELL